MIQQVLRFNFERFESRQATDECFKRRCRANHETDELAYLVKANRPNPYDMESLFCALVQIKLNGQITKPNENILR